MTPIRLLVLLATALVLACACSGGTSSPAPSLGTVETAEAAIARVVAAEPRLAGIEPYSDELIGQSAWYRAEPSGDGFEVEVYVGWGDCIAGCIDHHRWTFSVAENGSVELTGEEGSPVPATEWPSPAGSGTSGIAGIALAGPTCPVERPGDPNCAPRPVNGATVVIRDAQGADVATAVTNEMGQFFVELPAGSYTLEARPVDGLMGNPAPIAVEVGQGEATVELSYDTGIR